MSKTATLDAQYIGFEPFEAWTSVDVPTERWDQLSQDIEALKSEDAETYERALEQVKQITSYETGAIEDLYELKTGITITSTVESLLLEDVLVTEPEAVWNHFRAQLDALNFVLDFATKKRPIGEAWIRELHTVICGGQETYTAYTEVGPQEQLLPKGEYKTHPNHVLTREGSIHAYAPVLQTPSEMSRLVKELTSDVFVGSHPLLQIAFAHYAFVIIHPFADGNGRVARALASVYSHRAAHIPLLIRTDQRDQYYHVLSAADHREYAPFVSFIMDRLEEVVLILRESILLAKLPTHDILKSRHRKLYYTPTGYSHDEIQLAGRKLYELLNSILKSESFEATELQSQMRVVSSTNGHGFVNPPPTHKMPTSSTTATLSVASQKPASASSELYYRVLMPKNCSDDDLFIVETHEGESLEFKVVDVLPKVTSMSETRLRLMVRKHILQQIEKTIDAAESYMKKQGLL